MTRAGKWLLGGSIAVGALAMLALVLVNLFPSDEALAQRASAELQAALGVPVSVGSVHWRLLPSPTVVIENAATGQAEPVEVKKLTLYLDTAALWQRRLKVDRAELAGAVLPQLSLRSLGRQPPPTNAESQKKFSFDELPLAHIDFHDVTWISRRGIRTVYDGEADFDARWRPRTARLRRTGFTPATDLSLSRQGQDDRWQVRINLGGGTAHGEVQLQSQAKGGLRLTGKLQPQGIELASALLAFNRRAAVAGTASGETTLSATGAGMGDLAQSLHTSTSFRIGSATLLRFDLDKAVRSVGKVHTGKTPLDSITGQLDTQNTPQGMVLDYTRLKTSSGALSASGKAHIANRKIDAELAVDLVDGVVGVPLKVNGPLEQVQVSVPASAVAGAVAGTAVLPGIGTAIGARVGATLGKLFGSDAVGSKNPVSARN